MSLRHAIVTIIALTLGACVAVETGVDVPCRIGVQEAIARVWVQPDARTSGQGEWALWFDTVLFPVDGVASLVWSFNGDEGNPTRTRGLRLLALPTRIAAVLLPCITACPDLYHGSDPGQTILGLDWEGCRLERVSVPEGTSVAELRSAIVDALCLLAPAAPRSTIDARVHSVDLTLPNR